MEHHKPVALIILDGWGFREVVEGNAVAQANTPTLDKWKTHYEQSMLQASGEAVGLTAGQMGNSEVGHLNIGAGRVVYQDISRIDVAIKSGEFQKIDVLKKALQPLKDSGKKLHLFGLFGPGGVHSHTRHLYSLIELAEAYGVKPIVHVITDGRDTPPNSAIEFIKELEAFLVKHPATIGSISGRYYAMDRDKRWDRTKKAFDLYVHQQAPTASSLTEALEHSYQENVTDEFVIPTLIENPGVSTQVESDDCLIFFNFRADRMRQIVKSLVLPDFADFDRGAFSPVENVLTFTEYEKGLPVKVIFPKKAVTNPLAQVISDHGLKQFHAAETEKYAHVTFFFNGGVEQPFPGEERLLIQSPKVATYDLQPEMSAYELTDAVLARIDEKIDDLIVVNFANLDMVGHTGVLEAGIRAAEAVDECVGKVVEAIRKQHGVALITADHGNAEIMFDTIHQEPHTYHTTNLVRFFVLGDHYYRLRPTGSLQDIAPTILELLGISQPEEMTGISLIEESD